MRADLLRCRLRMVDVLVLTKERNVIDVIMKDRYIRLRKEARPDATEDLYYDSEKLAQLDIEQGRTTLTGEQLDGIVELAGAAWMMRDAIARLEAFMKKERGAYNAARSALGQIERTIALLRDRYSGSQVIALGNILPDAECYIICSGEKVPPSATNIDRRAFGHICQAAFQNCQMTCMKSRKASKNCALRRAYCMIPGLLADAQMNPFADDEHCLFAQYHPEVDEDEDV